MKRLLIGTLITVLLLMTLGYVLIWRSPDFYLPENSDCRVANTVWTMQQYSEVQSEHERPYIFNHDFAKGALVVFGSEHSRNPEDPQMEEIRSRWNSFEPTVALVEGRLGFLVPGFMNPIREFGEMGEVARLARKDKVPLYSWDISKYELALKAQESFKKDQIALSLILNPYFGSLRFGKPASPEGFVMNSIDRAGLVNMESEIFEIAHIDSLWSYYFPEGPDWRETSDQWGLPGFLQEIADENNLIRNRRLVCVISELVKKGQRVFVIAGSSHAVCIQNAFVPDSATSNRFRLSDPSYPPRFSIEILRHRQFLPLSQSVHYGYW